jgi:hypothetical protein
MLLIIGWYLWILLFIVSWMGFVVTYDYGGGWVFFGGHSCPMESFVLGGL